MMTRFLSGLFVAMLLCPAPAAAWVYYTSKTSGETVRWPDGGPCTIAFQYNPNGIDTIDGMKEFTLFDDAMALWNANPCTDVRFDLDGVDPACEIYANLGADQNCIVVSHDVWNHYDDWGNHNISAAALTILSYKPATGLLQDVDIDINEKFFDFSFCDDGEVEPWVDYRFVVAHELGHVYGLDHPDVSDAVLYSDGDIYCGDGKPHEPHADDFEGVCALYDRAIYACDDFPPEPEPEPEPVSDLVPDLVPEPSPESGGGNGSCGSCAFTPEPDSGPAVLFALVFFLVIRLLRSRTRPA